MECQLTKDMSVDTCCKNRNVIEYTTCQRIHEMSAMHKKENKCNEQKCRILQFAVNTCTYLNDHRRGFTYTVICT